MSGEGEAGQESRLAGSTIGSSTTARAGRQTGHGQTGSSDSMSRARAMPLTATARHEQRAKARSVCVCGCCGDDAPRAVGGGWCVGGCGKEAGPAAWTPHRARAAAPARGPRPSSVRPQRGQAPHHRWRRFACWGWVGEGLGGRRHRPGQLACLAAALVDWNEGPVWMEKRSVG